MFAVQNYWGLYKSYVCLGEEDGSPKWNLELLVDLKFPFWPGKKTKKKNKTCWVIIKGKEMGCSFTNMLIENKATGYFTW